MRHTIPIAATATALTLVLSTLSFSSGSSHSFSASLKPGSLELGSLAHAVELADGKTYFEAVPRLNRASITRQTVSDNNVGYYFDLTVPEDAGEALERVEINQRNGHTFTQEVEFELDDSRAFEGRRRDRGTPIAIGAVSVDEQTHTVGVTFDPPIPPGTAVTLRLKAERNPRQSGVYLFGVTAYPEGEQAHGQFLGFGRFHIYDSRSTFFR